MTDAVTGQPSRLSISILLLAAIFIAGGVMHFARPGPYVKIIPSWLPAPLLLVRVSGVCEILGGIGLLIPATRVAAGWGLLALLVAVFPANVQMLLNASAAGVSQLWLAALVARLPLQPLLGYWIFRAVIRSRP